MYKENAVIHWWGKTLWLLIGEMNIVNHLTRSHVKVWVIYSINEQPDGAGEMARNRDLSDFDKGQIVVARQVCQSLSETARVVGWSRSAFVRIY